MNTAIASIHATAPMAQCMTSTSLQFWKQQSRPSLVASNNACTTRVERLHKRPRTGPILAAATLEAPQAAVQPPPAGNPLAGISQHAASGPSQQQRARPRQRSPAWTAKDELATGLAVTWLGTSSGSPTAHRNVSCTVVRLPDSVFLVDCGEGSLRQILQTNVKLDQVEAILITHMHGDHCFGIGSMLPAISAAKQRAAAEAETAEAADAILSRGLRVYGPPGIVELLRATLILAGAGRALTMPLTITELITDPADAHPAEAMDAAGMFRVARQSPEPAPEVPGLQERLQATQQLTPIIRNRRYDNSHEAFVAQRGAVWTIPGSQATVRAAQLQHRVPCWGYVFEELLPHADATGSTQQPQHEEQNAPQQTPVMQALQRRLLAARQQETQLTAATASTATLPAATMGSRRPRKVVVLGDTMDSSAIAPLAVGADLLSHEATFQRGMEGKAVVAQHSTAWMAGQFAAVIGARVLVLTHFSSRYHGLEMRGAADIRASRHRQQPGSRHGGPIKAQAEFAENSAEAQEEEAVQQLAAVQQLVQEAAVMHPGAKVLAAKDMWTYAVPVAQ